MVSTRVGQSYVTLLTYGILIAEYETQSVYLVFVEWVIIQYSDVHLPFSKVVRLDQVNTRRQLLFRLGELLAESFGGKHEDEAGRRY